MQIKSKIIFVFIYIIFFGSNIKAAELNLFADEIVVDKKNNILVGKNNVKVTDNQGKIITADKATYEKSKEFLTAEGSVKVVDAVGNILIADKISYDKINNIIMAYNNCELTLNDGYSIESDQIVYNNNKKIISSNQNSIFKDIEGNMVTVNMFQYHVEKNLFSSVGKIKVIDIDKNRYYFKELHVDTKKREMIGSDVSVLFDQENFGVSKENDPRFVANDIFVSKNKSTLSKAVFTVCQQKEDKCPPWSLKAKEISHDKIKKTIYYKHATLKVFDVPIFYFPTFWHPDPTVKRQSGFLIPFFSDSTTVGSGFGLPYYWAISNDKDLTFTPKFYNNENILLLNEYRQAYRNASLILDTSYTEGYKQTSTKKTSGSRNHVFAELDIDLGRDKPYDSNLLFKIQKSSNDTYFRIHDINTTLVDSENTNLQNEISYNFNKNNTYLNIKGNVYENLREGSNSRYEYIAPNILFGKSFFSQRYGLLDFQTNALYRNFEVNKHITSLTNDIIWNPSSNITNKGFVNTLEGNIKNTNYDATNTAGYKTKGSINELSSVLSFKSSLPMKKEDARHSKIFTPNFMLRYAPGHMRDLSGNSTLLNYANLYTTNKTAVIEDGLSTILGFNFKLKQKNKENEEKEKLSISMGQVFNAKKNKDMPAKSSLDQKMSDLVGEINYNFSELASINYKFSLDHNYNDLNYNEVSTNLSFGKIDFNLDYLEQQNHVGNEHYVNAGISLNLNSNSTFNFKTKKNFRTNSTELYDLSYQYSLDCLAAGIVYRREFYEDSDVEKKDTLMFKITFVPFTGVKTPTFINP